MSVDKFGRSSSNTNTVVRQPVIKETLDMNNNKIIHVTDPLEN